MGLAEHSHLPTGAHAINQAIGDASVAAQWAAQGNGFGLAVGAPGRVQLTVQFPEFANDGDIEALQW